MQNDFFNNLVQQAMHNDFRVRRSQQAMQFVRGWDTAINRVTVFPHPDFLKLFCYCCSSMYLSLSILPTST